MKTYEAVADFLIPTDLHMGKKLRSTRLLLKDEAGNLHKLLRISDDNDKHNEPYFKIMFVEFQKGATLTQGIGMREIDGKTVKLRDSKPPVKCKVESLTYHYLAGVKHLKTVDGQYLSRHRDFPRLQDVHRPVLICCYTLDKFEGHTEISKAAREEDVVIERVKTPCVLEFFLSYRKTPDEAHAFIEHLDGESHCLVSSIDERTAITVTVMHYDDPHPSLTSGLFYNADAYAWEKGIAWYSKPIFKTKKFLAQKFPRVFKNWP